MRSGAADLMTYPNEIANLEIHSDGKPFLQTLEKLVYEK